MYQDPFKETRRLLNQVTSFPNRANELAQKPLIEVREMMNRTSRLMRPNIKPIRFDNSALLKLNIQTTLTSQQIRNNLFSDKILNEFIKSTSISKNEVLKMSNAFRNFSVDVVTTSTFTEPVNSSHPVYEPKENRDSYEFKEILGSHVITPSNELANETSKAIFVETIADFVVRFFLHQELVDASTYIWVLVFSYLGFLLSNSTIEKD